MKVSISKSEITGKVTAPSSKSYTIRGLMCAALAKGESQILNPLTSDDTEASIRVLGQIGVKIDRQESLWRVSGDRFHKPEADLFCGESAATLRFMTAICSIVPGVCRLTAGPSLAKRPIKTLVDALRQLGVKCSCHGEVAPVTVEGGKFKGGETRLPGDISSQFVTALLQVAPFAEEDMTIRLTTPLESRPYVAMTLDCMAKFGIAVREGTNSYYVKKQAYKPARYEVEGDWSSASYFLALGALCGEVQIDNLDPASLQGDKIMLNFIREMGTKIETKESSVVVSKSRLKAIRADLTDCIDMLPTVAVLATAAEGESVLTGIARARLKESDRVAAVKEGLEKLGVKVKVEPDRMSITGAKPQSAVIDSKDDHRIAMAFSVLGAACGGITIDRAECVAKTFPDFWEVFKGIGGRLDGK